MIVGCRVLLFGVIVCVVVCCRSLMLVVVCSCSFGSCWLFFGYLCLCFVVVCRWSLRLVRVCCSLCINVCSLLRVGTRVVVRVALLAGVSDSFLVVCCLCDVVCCILFVCCLMYCAKDC